MKGGLRFQILVLLGGLLLLAFLPLYYAIATYTSVALERAHGPVSTWIAERVVADLVAAEPAPTGQTVSTTLAATPLVAAVTVLSSDGVELTAAGDAAALAALRRGDTALQEPTFLVRSATANGRTARAAVRVHPLHSGALNRLLGLYMALVALALLVATHFTLTRWIIRPIGDLSLAAGRVAGTSRSFHAPRLPARELDALGESLSVMTRRLLDEESALRSKVAEVEQKTEELRCAQSQLVQSERLASVGQLAAGFAHEVGNPLAAISGMLDLLADGQLSHEEELDFVQRMQRETARIHGILQDLLQFARAAGPDGSLEQAPANVEAAIHETITLVTHQPLFREVALSVDVYPELPSVAFSHERLTQVLLNLLMNAAHACRAGGEVVVRARQNGRSVEIDVSDDGPGVPVELREKIFEPFVSTKDIGQGTGLGLSVCKGLIESSGGSLRLVDSERGAHFRVTLPPTQEPPPSPPGNDEKP